MLTASNEPQWLAKNVEDLSGHTREQERTNLRSFRVTHTAERGGHPLGRRPRAASSSSRRPYNHLPASCPGAGLVPCGSLPWGNGVRGSLLASTPGSFLTSARGRAHGGDGRRAWCLTGPAPGGGSLSPLSSVALAADRTGRRSLRSKGSNSRVPVPHEPQRHIPTHRSAVPMRLSPRTPRSSR